MDKKLKQAVENPFFRCKKCGLMRELIYKGICEGCWQIAEKKAMPDAVDELWRKIQDMSEGGRLTQAEWIMVLAEIEKRIARMNK